MRAVGFFAVVTSWPELAMDPVQGTLSTDDVQITLHMYGRLNPRSRARSSLVMSSSDQAYQSAEMQGQTPAYWQVAAKASAASGMALAEPELEVLVAIWSQHAQGQVCQGSSRLKLGFLWPAGYK
jgi:hypothetical protein